jgi:predicted nucleic acid-binding protein
MIVLDTNTISEIFKLRPQREVSDWLRDQAGEEIYTTAVTRGELLFGLHSMPIGRRRSHLEAGIARIFATQLAGRVLPYDSAAADHHAALAAARRAAGRPMAMADAMIAGIARSRGARLATRNVRDFEDCGLTLINPWQ